MKSIIAIALVATSFAALPAFGDTMSRPETNERRHCTQLRAQRAATRLPPRRLCRTPTQWEALLGPEWRRRLDAADVQAEIEAMLARMTADGETHGVAPYRSYGSPKQD